MLMYFSQHLVSGLILGVLCLHDFFIRLNTLLHGGLKGDGYSDKIRASSQDDEANKFHYVYNSRIETGVGVFKIDALSLQ